MTDRLKIGQEVLIHGYVDEIRKDTVIVRNEGGYFGTVECEVTDIEMPDTNKVLDKIRAEIAEYGSICVEYKLKLTGRSDKDIEQLVSDVLSQAKKQVLEVIDKYRGESEE